MKELSLYVCCIFLWSCTPTPVDINYHEDECANCKMIIADPNFGAELVTLKGKVHKYDSAECLFRELAENPTEKYAHILVTDYLQANKLIDASNAFFLISDQLPSPMGANLSSYIEATAAQKMQEEKGGDVFDFDEILEMYKKKY